MGDLIFVYLVNMKILFGHICLSTSYMNWVGYMNFFLSPFLFPFIANFFLFDIYFSLSVKI